MNKLIDILKEIQFKDINTPQNWIVGDLDGDYQPKFEEMTRIFKRIGGTDDEIESYFEDFDSPEAYVNLSIKDLIEDFKNFKEYLENDED